MSATSHGAGCGVVLAALSLGPALEEVDLEGFDDPDDVPITEQTFHDIQDLLHKLYLGQFQGTPAANSGGRCTRPPGLANGGYRSRGLQTETKNGCADGGICDGPGPRL